MQSQNRHDAQHSQTYTAIVELWAEERMLLGRVQPYTAKKAAEKARLFLPWLGNMNADEIEAESITRALIELGQTGGRHGDGLSSSTLRAAHLAGTQAIDWAIGKGFATVNPFKQTQRPKVNHPRVQFLIADQAAALASTMANRMDAKLLEGNVQQASFALAVCIALATGMRRGEIFALEWHDMNATTGRMSVSKAIKGDGKLGGPKSSSSIRSVAVGKHLIQLLNNMYEWQVKHLPPRTWAQGGHVLCSKNGERANMNTFEHWWRSWADSNGWPGLRFHDLRHSHATMLIANGVDVKTTQMRLGHSSAEVTLSIYAHAIPLADSAAAASLDAELFK